MVESVIIVIAFLLVLIAGVFILRLHRFAVWLCESRTRENAFYLSAFFVVSTGCASAPEDDHSLFLERYKTNPLISERDDLHRQGWLAGVKARL